MANKNILIKIEVNDKASPQIKNTGNAVDKLAKSVDLLSKSEQKEFVIAEQSRIKKTAQIQGLKQQAAAALQVAAATKQVKTTSGLNNAILLESGRLASDAAYGFQGIANNLGQLVSLFQISAKNAGGFGAALRQVGSQILGTGGVLIGIQLLISFLPEISKWFNKTSNAAEESRKRMEGLTKAISEQIEMFDRLTYKHLPDFILTGKALDEAVSFLTKTFSKFRAGMEILKEKGLDKNEESVRNLVKSFGELQLLQKDLKITNDEYLQSVEKEGEISLEAIRLRGKYNKILREVIALEKLFTTVRIEGREEEEELLVNIREETERLERVYRSKGIVDIIDQENEKQRLLLQTVEKGFGERFGQMKANSKKELDLFFKNLKIERDEKERQAKLDEILYKRIQDNKLEALAVFTDGFSKLLGEQTAAGKAFASATALIDTYAGIAKVWKDETIQPFAFKAIAAAGILASGLSTVAKINAVNVSGKGSSSAAGGTINAPDFNVVGASETSQLAQAVGRGNQNSVVKAYVVGSEITSQQEFDRKITNTAGL